MKIKNHLMMMSFAILAALTALPANAEDKLPALSNYLRSEVLRARNAVSAQPASGPDEGYFFKRWGHIAFSTQFL